MYILDNEKKTVTYGASIWSGMDGDKWTKKARTGIRNTARERYERNPVVVTFACAPTDGNLSNYFQIRRLEKVIFRYFLPDPEHGVCGNPSKVFKKAHVTNKIYDPQLTARECKEKEYYEKVNKLKKIAKENGLSGILGQMKLK
jgi:hypothetical protein